MAEHPAVNRTVISSSLIAGAFFLLFIIIKIKKLCNYYLITAKFSLTICNYFLSSRILIASIAVLIASSTPNFLSTIGVSLYVRPIIARTSPTLTFLI